MKFLFDIDGNAYELELSKNETKQLEYRQGKFAKVSIHKIGKEPTEDSIGNAYLRIEFGDGNVWKSKDAVIAKIQPMKATNKTYNLYVLANSVWDADDYLNGRNCNPHYTDLYLYATREEAEKKASELDFNNDIYNDGYIYTDSLTEDEILELTGFDSIEDFDEALAEPYSTQFHVKNFGENEKGEVARAIIEKSGIGNPVTCNNYDFKKSLEGCILVFWAWERYIGYARKCIEIRWAENGETEELLAKQDKVNAAQCDILLTAEEVKNARDIKEAVRDAMEMDSWKWQNESYVESQIEDFEI